MSRSLESKVKYLFKPNLVNVVEETEPKQFYTTVLISSEEKVDLKTYKMTIEAIGKMCKVNWLGFHEGKYLEVSGRLNEWGANYNERIQKDFGDRVVNKVIELMEAVNVDSYKLTIFRCEMSTHDISDDIYIEIQK